MAYGTGFGTVVGVGAGVGAGVGVSVDEDPPPPQAVKPKLIATSTLSALNRTVSSKVFIRE
jgi:hypothetical protein